MEYGTKGSRQQVETPLDLISSFDSCQIEPGVPTVKS